MFIMYYNLCFIQIRCVMRSVIVEKIEMRRSRFPTPAQMCTVVDWKATESCRLTGTLIKIPPKWKIFFYNSKSRYRDIDVGWVLSEQTLYKFIIQNDHILKYHVLLEILLPRFLFIGWQHLKNILSHVFKIFLEYLESNIIIM